MIRWPGKILSNKVTDEMVASLDIYRTLLELAGAKLPDHPIDGFDILPFLLGQANRSPRKEYAYFRNGLEAMRIGEWKLRLASGEPELFNLQEDPGERYNRAADKPELVNEIRKRMEVFAGEVGVSVSEAKLIN